MEIEKFIKKWWGCAVIFLLIGVYLFFYFFRSPQSQALTIISFLINSFVSLAVVIYVIYTRDLAKSSQATAEASIKTAEANIRLVESMQSMLLEQWACELKENQELIRDGEMISRSIHVEDKHISADHYSAHLRKPKKRTLIFKPLNCGSRPVILYSVKFEISETRSRRPREITYDPPTPIVINKDQEKEILVAYNIEGEIEIRVVEINYQDGDKKQNRWIANAYKEIDRYQEPEGSTT